MDSVIDDYMENIRRALRGEKAEEITLQTIHLQCGLCGERWEMNLVTGDMKLLACPDCGNTTLQMVRGV